MGWCREARIWHFDSRGYEIPETDTGGSKEASSTAVGGLWDLREMTERPTGPFEEGWSRWVWEISPPRGFLQATDGGAPCHGMLAGGRGSLVLEA